MNDFEAVPVLDYDLRSTDKPAFLTQLRHALVRVGVLYLVNHPIDPAAIDAIVAKYIPAFFALPQGEKHRLQMANSPHFLGYNWIGTEFTKNAVDHREQFDFATERMCKAGPGDPDYYKLCGPNQWPEEHLIPGFRDALNLYLDQVTELSYNFSSLIAEALGLPPDGLAQFYDKPSLIQHRAKIVKYPVVQGQSQGVGPHYDAGFLTFLVQASPHKGLQVQNLAGSWVDATPLPGSLVVNFGKALEFVTRGLIRATPHRVLSPKGDTPRYSIPFFQNISLDIRLADHVLDFSPQILELVNERGAVGATEPVNFTEIDRETTGKATLIAQVKSHPDVARRHYPELFKLYFPEGRITAASAY